MATMRRWLSLLWFALNLPAAMPASGKSDLNKTEQCVVVLTENWDATNGVLRAFERNNATGPWKKFGSAVPVVVGKKGLGEGLGMIALEFTGAPQKKEGDNKAPAGIFHLSSAFGYAPRRSARWVKLPYLPLSKTIEGVDDPESRYYTKLVDRSRIAHPDWRSSERMLRDDVRYKWGVVVAHNSRARPGAGSCIFLHVWMNSSTATTGCTAMEEKDLIALLRWLDPKRQPVLIQMPRVEYAKLYSKYAWPRDQ
jgi:L,D-peptidoglycan transpeptidase YkuD (ErfK/YbiS/YcfS/YnhG family)